MKTLNETLCERFKPGDRVTINPRWQRDTGLFLIINVHEEKGKADCLCVREGNYGAGRTISFNLFELEEQHVNTENKS